MNKPCPFCQCKQSRIVQYDGDVWRTCKSCGVSTVACGTPKRATEVWNMRVRSEKLKQAIYMCNDVTEIGQFAKSVDPVRWVKALQEFLKSID